MKLILIDPKIVELKLYNDIPHLLTPVITEPKRAFQALQYCICEMERRYSLLDGWACATSGRTTARSRRGTSPPSKLPYIVVVIDEFADLMATTGKELESTLARLAAMSRAVGIHLVLATQRPSIDVITGPHQGQHPLAHRLHGGGQVRLAASSSTRWARRSSSGGATCSSPRPGTPSRCASRAPSSPRRRSSASSSYVKTLGEPEYIDDEIFIEDEDGRRASSSRTRRDDPLMDKALEIVLASRARPRASYLQRRLKIGYNRAARLVEMMEHRGIVGPANGTKPREILHVPDRNQA